MNCHKSVKNIRAQLADCCETTKRHRVPKRTLLLLRSSLSKAIGQVSCKQNSNLSAQPVEEIDIHGISVIVPQQEWDDLFENALSALDNIPIEALDD